MAFGLEMKLSGLDGVLDLLKRMPPEVVSKNGGPVLFALRKGAVLIRNQARLNFSQAVSQAGKTGITDSTGFTGKQIVIKRKRPLNGENGERVIIAVRYEVHPNGHFIKRGSRSRGLRRRKGPSGRPIRANDIAFMMEYGTSKQASTPWLRPAFAAKASEAIFTIERELIKRINRIVKKLSKTGGLK